MGDFYRDVICRDRRFRSPQLVNDVALLEPATRAAIACIVADAAKLGHRIVVLETYRSKERQAALFRKGATKLRNVGVHHYGLAADLGLFDSGTFEPDGQKYLFLRELAESHGLIWGGDWGTPKAPHNFRDYDHVQRCSIQRQTHLFDGSWYPDAAYDPLADYGRSVPKCAGTPAQAAAKPASKPVQKQLQKPAPKAAAKVKAAGKTRRFA